MIRLAQMSAAVASSDEARARYFYGQLQQGRFHLAFQPVVAPANAQRTLYHEGLLRSSGEALDFNPFAVLERLQSIRQLDCCVANSVIALLQSHPSLTLGCNISAQSARLDSHWERVLQQLADDANLARRLVIEITESSAQPSHEQAIEFVHQLRSTGCHVAIDDFGSGFATLTFIQQGQPDLIKIDQGYIRRARQSSLHGKTLKHLIGLCSTLAAHVVVEGIETTEDLEIAQECDAQWVQGFLFARPQALIDGLEEPCVIASR
ncbi:EAL domain-containing protein [Pseudomonas sp. MM211]|uniref:EAL domain-containing protein n=1 Tax=Pseudomonas sp. MM211 TaxID=2866808 RepID=UPI001CECBE7E|nr:EAL domain-containing protein [Pseudomonas sp. MM211]UCJ14740.1 EAL domain-containing protein [Pseudomonas sp. MM211]